MNKAVKKIISVILVLVMMSGFSSVVVFAEEAPETTTAASETDIKDAIDGGLNFFQKINKFFYDFLNFMHEQYLKFVGNSTGYDPFEWMFKDTWV